MGGLTGQVAVRASKDWASLQASRQAGSETPTRAQHHVHMLDRRLLRLVLFLDATCLDSFGIQHALHLCKLPRLLRLPHDGQTDDMRVGCVESDSRRV